MTLKQISLSILTSLILTSGILYSQNTKAKTDNNRISIERLASLSLDLDGRDGLFRIIDHPTGNIIYLVKPSQSNQSPQIFVEPIQ